MCKYIAWCLPNNFTWHSFHRQFENSKLRLAFFPTKHIKINWLMIKKVPTFELLHVGESCCVGPNRTESYKSFWILVPLDNPPLQFTFLHWFWSSFFFWTNTGFGVLVGLKRAGYATLNTFIFSFLFGLIWFYLVKSLCGFIELVNLSTMEHVINFFLTSSSSLCMTY